MSLTSHLIGLLPDELKAATEHPFLKQAAMSSLSQDRLKAWLGQDRLYACSYIFFISNILGRISIPSQECFEDSLNGRLASELIDCLINIRREIKLFEKTANDEGWLGDIKAARPSVQTRAYQDLFAGAALPVRPLLTAVVTLWATEYCYLQAWSHAASFLPTAKDEQELDVMQRVFIPNWSSDEFAQFVERLGKFVDDLAAQAEKDSTEWQEAEIVWRQVLVAEKNFWPDS